MNYNPTQAKLFFLWKLFESAEDVPDVVWKMLMEKDSDRTVQLRHHKNSDMDWQNKKGNTKQ